MWDDPIFLERRKKLHEAAVEWYRHWRECSHVALRDRDWHYRAQCKEKIRYWLARMRASRPIVFFEGQAAHLAEQRSRARPRTASTLAKLTDDQVREILLSKEPAKTLATQFGVSAQTITNVRHRRVYNHVQVAPIDLPVRRADPALPRTKAPPRAARKAKSEPGPLVALGVPLPETMEAECIVAMREGDEWLDGSFTNTQLTAYLVEMSTAANVVADPRRWARLIAKKLLTREILVGNLKAWGRAPRKFYKWKGPVPS